MKVEFDREANAAFISFKEIGAGKVSKTISLSSSLNVDLDKEGKLLGIEILEVSKNVPDKKMFESCSIN